MNFNCPPQRGPSGVVLLLGVSTVMALGFYKISQTNQRKRSARSLVGTFIDSCLPQPSLTAL